MKRREEKRREEEGADDVTDEEKRREDEGASGPRSASDSVRGNMKKAHAVCSLRVAEAPGVLRAPTVRRRGHPMPYLKFR